MSRLFTFFEILSHNLAFVCAPPPQSTTGHTPHLFCLHLRVYRPAGAIRRSARLLSATIHRALSPASRKRDTRSMLRLFRCAQYAYAMRYCPCGQYAHLCASIAPLGQYDALRGYCLRQYTALYRPHRANAIRAPCYGYFAALNTPTPCAIAHAGNTRICARLFRCAQYAVPAPLCAQSIVCTQSNPLRALFTVPPHPHSPHLWRMRRKPARTHDKF